MKAWTTSQNLTSGTLLCHFNFLNKLHARDGVRLNLEPELI